MPTPSDEAGPRAEAGPPGATGALDASARPRLARHVRMSFDRARQRHVLLRPETITVLNPTGADILELCDGERTVAEIVVELSARYDRVVDGEVHDFLARLAARRCVEIAS